MSQQELADRASIHRTYLSDLENGRRHVTVEVLAVVAEGLHIKISKLIAYAEKISDHSEEDE